MKMAVDSMEMAPTAIPSPGRVPEYRLLSPEIGLRWRRHCGTFRDSILDLFRAFASKAIYRRKGDVREHPRGPHHTVAQPEVGPRHPMVWPPPGSSPSPLWTPCT
jgi:hypothetical protein